MLYINPLRIAKSDSDELTHYSVVLHYPLRIAKSDSDELTHYSVVLHYPLRIAKSDSDEHTHYDNNEQIFIIECVKT